MAVAQKHSPVSQAPFMSACSHNGRADSKPMAISTITSPGNSSSLCSQDGRSTSEANSPRSSSSSLSPYCLQTVSSDATPTVKLHTSSSVSHTLPSYRTPSFSSIQNPNNDPSKNFSLHRRSSSLVINGISNNNNDNTTSSLFRDSSHHHQQPSYAATSPTPQPHYAAPLMPLSPEEDGSLTRNQQSAPLSLQERRRRNKAASAKYRAKKNQQHGEMRGLIASLTRENELLQRQLENLSHENNRLKATCDRLRGKILAGRMLKKMLSAAADHSASANGHQPSIQQMQRLEEEDMDFDEDDVKDLGPPQSATTLLLRSAREETECLNTAVASNRQMST